jgi:molybdopterin-guanine dinucleotide biosynthesis protein A
LIPDATGFVLAGGHSRRMGLDKARLRWAEGTLLGHAIERLRGVCPQVVVLSGSTPRYQDLGAPVLTDVVAEAGPLGGLLTALEHAATPLALVLAVDLPFVTQALLAHLVERAQEADAVVPSTGGRPQPLCAAYRTTCAEPVRRRLSTGERKMTCFWPDVRVRELPESELAAFGDPARLLGNLNTRQEYEAARTEGT